MQMCEFTDSAPTGARGTGKLGRRVWRRAVALCSVAAACALVAGACASAGEDGPVLGDVLEGGTRLDSRLVLERAQSDLEEPVRTVFRGDAPWRRFLERALGPGGSRRSVPDVGFDDRMAVVAGMGRRATGGFQLDITGVYERSDSLFVAVQHLLPGQDCIVTQSVTSPLQAVSVPRRRGPVRFVVEERTLDCSH